MSMMCRVRISLDVGRERASEICRVLAPDNVDMPDGLKIHMDTIKTMAIIDMHSTVNVQQLIGTVDEILSHVQVALDVVNPEGT